MKRWEVELAINKADVSKRSKSVGLFICQHWSADKNQVRLRLDTIQKEIGCKSTKTITRAINELIDADVFTRVKTGRASILRLGKRVCEYTATYSRRDKNRIFIDQNWREFFPGCANLSDIEMVRELTEYTSSLASQHNNPIQIEPYFPSTTKRTDGINASRFKEFCPIKESSESPGERYTKNYELYLSL